MGTVPGKPPGKNDIDACRRCDLWKRATQGVSGEGPASARVMLVGEQPGDEEDLQGRPFVGAAGRMLRGALADAGIDIDDVYLTNAVKHFSWEPRGKRRIHKTPAQREIAACRAWLDEEIARVGPAVIVALGATALNGVMGSKMKVGDARSRELIHPLGARVIATYHPAAVLRAPDPDAKADLMRALVADLARAVGLAARPTS